MIDFKSYIQDYESRNGLKNFQKFLDDHNKIVEVNSELEVKLAADKETVEEYLEGYLNAQLYNLLYDKEWVEENGAFDFSNPSHKLFYKQWKDYCGIA